MIVCIHRYDGAIIKALGSVTVMLEIDGVSANVKLYIVPREAQTIPLIFGHPFTEQRHMEVVKRSDALLFSQQNENAAGLPPQRAPLWAKDASVIPNNILGDIVIRSNIVGAGTYAWDWRPSMPRCVFKTDSAGESTLPILKISRH